MGDAFFGKIKDSTGSTGDLEESILGPDYKYYQFIKSPSDIGMSSEGSLEVLGKDIKGLISYTQLLVTGKGDANGSKTGKPLGNKFFMDTGATCTDADTSSEVNRSIYIDNVPSGSIPFITSGTGVQFTEFEGLVPGTLENITRLNPIKIFKTFTNGANPKCRAITMEVINKDSESSFETKYVTDDDIADIPACSFNEKKNPITKTECVEAFTTSGMSGSFGGNRGNINLNNRRHSSQLYSYSTPVPPKPCIIVSENVIISDVSKMDDENNKIGKIEGFDTATGLYESVQQQQRKYNPYNNKSYSPYTSSYQETSYKVIPREIITERDTVSKSEFPEDVYIKIYFSTLGLFGLYLLTKLIAKQGVFRI